jgi:(3S)-linalool synthase
LGLVNKLGFARDRPTECFLWTVGIFPEPCYSNCRIELAKTVPILLVMDDIFDTYGTLDELVLFTNAIKRCASLEFVSISNFFNLKTCINI